MADTGPKVSAVIAVLDEEPRLDLCLRQLAWVDEIVVIDMGSRDRTVEVARRFTDRVFVHDGGPFGLVHVNKNVGFDRARGPWILDIDADEIVTPDLAREIRETLAGAPAEAAFAIPFRHFLFGRFLTHGGWRDAHVRLLRKGACRYEEDRAHSSLVVEGAVGRLREPVIHMSHPRITDFIRRMDRYTTSDARGMAETGTGGLRNRPVPRLTRSRLARAALAPLWDRWIRRAGFLDGVPGLIAAVLLGVYQFVEYAKVWEIRNVREDR